MAAPEDTADVLSALRLGWYMAEVRGRSRPGSPVTPAESLPNRAGHMLPLRIERTPGELRIEAQAVIRKLAADLEVDTVTVNGQPRNLADHVVQQAVALAGAKPQAAPDVWRALALSIYQFDAHIQDALAAQSGTRSAAYQLGRGLAEVYWALDPAAQCDPPAPDCWTFLLGTQRCGELTRLAAGRLYRPGRGGHCRGARQARRRPAGPRGRRGDQEANADHGGGRRRALTAPGAQEPQ